MPSGIRTPQEKEAEVIRLYQTGLSAIAVSAAIGVTERKVRRMIGNAGITRRPGRLAELVDPETAAEVIRLYQAGLSVIAVSAKAGVTKETVRRLVRGAGIMRTRGLPPVPPGVRRAIAAACGAGMTAGQAAARYQVSRETVFRILGVPGTARPPGMITAAQAGAAAGIDPKRMCYLACAGLIRTWRPRPGARQLYHPGDVAEVAALLRRRRAQAAGPERDQESTP